MPNRFQEAWWALLGRAPDRARYQKVITELRAQWLDLMIEIDSTIEKLTAVDTRLRKRLERAEQRGVAAQAESNQAPPLPDSSMTPKQRARMKARMRGLIGPAARERAVNAGEADELAS